jgi:hypothetical protein
MVTKAEEGFQGREIRCLCSDAVQSWAGNASVSRAAQPNETRVAQRAVQFGSQA